jgi:TonB-dependent receptor
MRALIALFFSFSLMAKIPQGELHLFVFKDGLPQEKVRLKIDQDSVVTNAEGLWASSLTTGLKEIVLEGLEPVKVRIISGKTTQVSFSLSSTGENRHDIIAPEIVSSSAASSEQGIIQGEVFGGDGAPLAGARVFVRGSNHEVTSGPSGKFELRAALGEQFLIVIHRDHASSTVKAVVKNKNEVTKVRAFLAPTGLVLEDLIVEAPHVRGSASALVEIRREATQVADVLGAEQMSRSGDSDAASSLKRVTGLTLVDGKYVYVRGLGERYSSTLVNGAMVPGPDPTRKVVPLDLFPSSVIEGIVVQKSYSADMPAEFGGGSVQIKTKSVPEENFFKIELSTSASDSKTEAMAYKGGSRDWLGMDDGTRSLPFSVSQATAGNKKLAENNIVFNDGYTSEQLAAFGRDMPRIYTPGAGETATPPSLSLAGGRRFQLGSVNAGFLSALMYGNDIEAEEKVKRSYIVESEGVLKLEKDFRVNATEQTIKLGGMLSLGAEIGKNHRIEMLGLVLRKTTDTTETSEGYHSDLERIRTTSLEWVERQLSSVQLSGDHHTEGDDPYRLKWRATLSEAAMLRPDARDYRYEWEIDSYKFSTRNDGNQRTYSELVDQAKEAGADLSIPLPWFGSRALVAKVGAMALKRERESTTRRFTFVDKGGADEDGTLRVQRLEDILAPENIVPGAYQLQENTLATDNYNAEQTIVAQYFSFEAPLPFDFNLGAGMRFERSEQLVKTYELFDPDNRPTVAALTTIDRLPSYYITWKLAPAWQLRAAYSETVARPDFKELSTATYTDDERGVDVVGNENLDATVIENIDFRIEWYGQGQDLASIGLFEKRFERPIESVIRPGTEGKMSFDNALGAVNRGLEFEFNKELGFIARKLSPLSFGSNMAWIDSEIHLDPSKSGVLTSETRALQGQSPYVYNFNLVWDNKESGTTATLLYNIFGERISDVGTMGAPDIVEESFQQLDFVVSQKFANYFTAKLKLKNLIDPEHLRTQGGEVVEQYQRGREISLALSGNF